MTDEELSIIFESCLKGKPPEGWAGRRHPDIDSVTNGSQHRIWVRHNDPEGPWTEVPGMAG